MSQYPPPPPGQQPRPQPPYPPQPGMPPGVHPGAPQPAAYTMNPAVKRGNGAAVTSLILGIIFCVPFLTGFLAIIFGFVGIRKTRDPQVGGKGMAVTGLILGLLSVLGWGLMFGAGGYGIYAAWKHGEPARNVAKQFAKDLSTGNIDAAKAQTTDKVNREELVQAADAIKALGAVQDTTLFSSSYRSVNGVTTMDVAGIATFPNNKSVPYAVHLVKEGDAFKIDGFMLQDYASVGTTPKGSGSRSGSGSGSASDDEE